MFNKCYIILLLILPLTVKCQIKNPLYKLMIDSFILSSPIITIDSFKNLKNTFVLDTRESTEYEVSHIKNARNVGYIWFDMRNVYDIPKTANIVVYCTIGFRSQKICQKLTSLGYQHVYNLYGSIFEWVNRGYPVYKSNGIQTSEIHTYDESWAKWVSKGTIVY